MSRAVNLILFLFVLIGAVWLYQVKHEASVEEDRAASLQKQIDEEKEALLLLKAEWSYLNRPQRVQELAEKFSQELGLEAVEPHQIGSVSELPERQLPASVSGGDQQGLDDLLKQAEPASLRLD